MSFIDTRSRLNSRPSNSASSSSAAMLISIRGMCSASPPGRAAYSHAGAYINSVIVSKISVEITYHFRLHQVHQGRVFLRVFLRGRLQRGFEAGVTMVDVFLQLEERCVFGEGCECRHIDVIGKELVECVSSREKKQQRLGTRSRPRISYKCHVMQVNVDGILSPNSQTHPTMSNKQRPCERLYAPAECELCKLIINSQVIATKAAPGCDLLHRGRSHTPSMVSFLIRTGQLSTS